MARAPGCGPAEQPEYDTQAAGGGPRPVGYPTYRDVAVKLFENGYEPLPLHIGQKRPIPKGWSATNIDRSQVEQWALLHPDAGVGLRTGHLVGIDIDVLDPMLAHQMGQIVEARIGAAPMRVGLWPKRLYLARAVTPFAKVSLRKLEVLGKGQQFVAFGRHPDTGRLYYWPTDDTPLDVPLANLPLVDEVLCKALLSELAELLPAIGEQQRRRSSSGRIAPATSPVRNPQGLVSDGRDGWLSSIAYHAVQDAIEAGRSLQEGMLAERVWQRFSDTAELARGKKDGAASYGFEDALKKVRDKLHLLEAGRLPPRAGPAAEPVAVDPGMPVAEARDLLSSAIAEFCASTEAWHRSDKETAAPCRGLRATVGLGKSALARTHLTGMQARLRDARLPHRILVFVPSLALADEAAAGWATEGLRVAVHRGYEANQPGSSQTMCRDLDMVRMAIACGLPVFPNACLRAKDARCTNFEQCAKQDNRREVAEADIVLAAYDSLFTGLSVSADKVAAVVVDEGCWERAIRRSRISVAEVTAGDVVDEPRLEDPQEEERARTELSHLRALLAAALLANGAGPVSRAHLTNAGLTGSACARATALELLLRADPGLRPGLPQAARARAIALSQDSNRSVRREALFRALEAVLAGSNELDGRITILPPDPESGATFVEITCLERMDAALAQLPLLHLDATLRPGLAETVLSGLEITEITAAMPHMRLTTVQGSFGKSSLVEEPKASPEEKQRRRRRLQECVDHVRWEAARVAPGRTLVVTYKQIEAAFSWIPGVTTGHFKAIAGLDVHKDVTLLIVIGRPLPGDADVRHLTSAYFGHLPRGGYASTRRALLMRDGSRRAISVIQHQDDLAELLRSAICDDEVIQAIGRGRGVNRTEANPLEVQLLADVALPMVHDRVVAWDTVAPDLFQKMLLEGLAVDSPADAAQLHSTMLRDEKQAQKAFERAGFKRQIPIDNPYRKMSLKSASYRRGGRGRGWQRVWWISGSEADARARLEAALGPIVDWRPEAL